MSYASAAAKGPKQSPEEARAPPQPELEHTESPAASSLIDVDMDSVHTVPSDFTSEPVQTTTQAQRLEREAELQELANSKAVERKKEPKATNNLLHLGNALAGLSLTLGLGFGAYKKYAAGELTWKLAATWTGVVGLFATGDYFLSQFLYKKYPPKY